MRSNYPRNPGRISEPKKEKIANRYNIYPYKIFHRKLLNSGFQIFLLVSTTFGGVKLVSLLKKIDKEFHMILSKGFIEASRAKHLDTFNSLSYSYKSIKRHCGNYDLYGCNRR